MAVSAWPTFPPGMSMRDLLLGSEDVADEGQAIGGALDDEVGRDAGVPLGNRLHGHAADYCSYGQPDDSLTSHQPASMPMRPRRGPT